MNYQFCDLINLFVEGRISEADAIRQTKTVKAILERFNEQPGVILADEVGMGKTFVALAAAISVYLKEKKPAIIMVPPNLVIKWSNDFMLFQQACIQKSALKDQLRCSIVSRPEELLNQLDENEDKRPALILLKHGALSRRMGDGFIKLAIIQKAVFRRRHIEDLNRSIAKYAGTLIEMKYLEKCNANINIWLVLLNESPSKWKSILVRHKFLESNSGDPVPKSFITELNKVSFDELNELFEHLNTIPLRTSINLDQRLKEVRTTLNNRTAAIWKRCFSKIKLDLPLLIFDEAHHLKNSDTQLVTKLFHEPIAEEDAGLLSGQFDRMLFLTATPFQLGHHELLNVLERFSAINWDSDYTMAMTCVAYRQELDDLLRKLDHSQIFARRLDNSWSKLTKADLSIGERFYSSTIEWWNAIQRSDEQLGFNVQKIIDDFRIAKQKLKSVEPLLQKYVIRHLKSRKMGHPFDGVPRRINLPGNAIVTGSQANVQNVVGLYVTNESMLSFLLAARLTTIQQDKRPVFAEGLASSFEAYRFTKEMRAKKKKEGLTDVDDDFIDEEQVIDPVSSWYLDQLDKSLEHSLTSGSRHPKIKPTVGKAIELWKKGEKVLIFCHYIATGKALRNYISHEMKVQIIRHGAAKFNCKESEVFSLLEKTGNRITKVNSSSHKRCVQILTDLISKFRNLDSLKTEIIEAVLRYMKTPSFLLRFAVKAEGQAEEDWIDQSFAAQDESGLSLWETIRGFVLFLNSRNEDRNSFIEALKSIQPGGIKTKDVMDGFKDDELPDEQDNIIMANVRLCYGATNQETRQKLMKTFNTPFFPDILITSSVMSEGVDLHLNCRHIIHHDLCWNPSTLEQRTGRVDRIGAKSEKYGKSINVYLPFLSETQDEKMYKVVMERERWFNIIMGENYKVDAANTDRYAERIPLPEELSRELSFKLEV